MGDEECYIAEPYKVKHYDWSHKNGYRERKSHWAAYYRIYDNNSEQMLFGNSVEKVGLYEGKEYTTKEQAFKVCQKHYDTIWPDDKPLTVSH